uniref:ATP synthase F0 subunit 8 n=1 Tax=Polysiphonia morrowii TaxID=173542 RepID=UPI002E784362|nr:ATP synthase F0 subunit 8 [Polysiphonia morrowii]WQF69615.1 ATP synthase F0 subunit 8 [Polysiphonia morrowii]
MPQLDFLIILPQIFWLILSFTLFYFVLTYYFLPTFLKTINSRKQFIKFNKKIELQLANEVFNKRQFVLKELNFNLNRIRSILFSNLMHTKFDFIQSPFKSKYSKLNSKILVAVNKSIFYCNLNSISLLQFYPLVLNKTRK